LFAFTTIQALETDFDDFGLPELAVGEVQHVIPVNIWISFEDSGKNSVKKAESCGAIFSATGKMNSSSCFGFIFRLILSV
jgi:hypothetical protein